MPVEQCTMTTDRKIGATVDEVRIARVEWGKLAGLRPRGAGRNARLDEHGDSVCVSVARLTADDGSTGFGACYPTPELQRELPGTHLCDAFSFQRGVADEWLPVEYPLWDLMAWRAGVPVYQLAAQMSGVCPPRPYRVHMSVAHHMVLPADVCRDI